MQVKPLVGDDNSFRVVHRPLHLLLRVAPRVCAPDSFSFFPIALADVDGHVASDEFLRRPRQRMCPAASGFGQFKRWE